MIRVSTPSSATGKQRDLVAESALHPTAVFLPVLMANQAEARAPLGQPSLVRTTVANSAGSHMSHVTSVIAFGITGMA